MSGLEITLWLVSGWFVLLWTVFFWFMYGIYLFEKTRFSGLCWGLLSLSFIVPFVLNIMFFVADSDSDLYFIYAPLIMAGVNIAALVVNWVYGELCKN